MKFLEKDMEDLIASDPIKYLDEELKLVSRQYSIGSYRFDLLFEDRHGAKLIVEIQKGTLDRNHTYKILDYYDEYKHNNPNEYVELMVVANSIPRERRDRLKSKGISYKEISESVFIENLKEKFVEVEPKKNDSNNYIDSIKVLDEFDSKKYESKSKDDNDISLFWNDFLNIANKKTNIYNGLSHNTTKHYINIKTKFNGITYPTVCNLNKSWVELCIQMKTESESFFQLLYDNKSAIESEFGEQLIWENKPDVQRCKIMSSPVNEGRATNNIELLSDQLVDKMIKLYSSTLKYIEF